MQRASCLSCHRRKLKCTREDAGCSNCRKGNQKCEYPAAEARARGKRGPYQKRTTKRERDLDQELKVTEAKYKELASRLEEQSRNHTQNPLITHQTDILTNDATTSISDLDLSGFEMIEEVQQTHPPIALDQMLQLWHVFVTRVDPMTKVIHRPSFEKKLFTVKNDIHATDPSVSTLMYSIYFAAVKATSASEAQLRFGESRDLLLDRFQTAIDRSLAVAQVSSTPNFTTLQALVLYIVSLRRQESGVQLWPLFGLAVRMAQLLQMGSDDASSMLSPLEIELRRRIWWLLVTLEKQCAEELASQPASFMAWSNCSYPLNVNDDDLDPQATDLPQPRNGITDMSFLLMRFEMLSLFGKLIKMKPDPTISDPGERRIRLAMEKEAMLVGNRSRLDKLYLQHCSMTRPFDWTIITFAEGFLAKAELMGRKSVMSDNETFQLSLIVLRNTYLLQTDPRAENWSWFFRDFVQSHALVQVVSQLCKGTQSTVDPANISDAWAFIEQIVERIPPRRRRDPTVSPILTLMTLARQRRASSFSTQTVMGVQEVQPSTSSRVSSIAHSTSGPPLQPFPDAWTENAVVWSSSFLHAAITTPESVQSGFQSPPFQQVGTVGPSMDGYTGGSWPAADFLVNDPPTNNIDWSHWNGSLDVFNTNFGRP